MRELDGARYAGFFATPVLEHLWADGPELNLALRASILDQSRRHPGKERTNVGGWHSETGVLEFCGAAGERLIQHMRAMIDEATLRLHAEYSQPAVPLNWTLGAWANVNRRGDFNTLHTHPGATWSGVYYVDHGEASDAAEGTALQLFDPNPARTNIFFPELSTANVLIKSQPGLMILFPSYLPHAVPPHQGDRPRISIAFNVRKDPFP